MNYYKVNINTILGGKIKNLLTEVAQCEQSAEEFAKRVGAVAYTGAVDVDFGGVSAFEFPHGFLPDLAIFELVGSEDGFRWYAPKVEVKQQPMPSEVALQHRGSFGQIVPDAEKTFREIAFMFSRKEAAKMAGVICKQPSVEDIVSKLKISPVEMRMLKSGIVDFNTMFPDRLDNTPERVSQSIEEDKRIMDALGDQKFRIVITITCSRKAVQLYKQMLALPTVPRGMTNALLSIDSPNSRAGLAEFDQHIYICSGEPATGSELQEVPEEEFLQMKNVLESSAKGNVVAQA